MMIKCKYVISFLLIRFFYCVHRVFSFAQIQTRKRNLLETIKCQLTIPTILVVLIIPMRIAHHSFLNVRLRTCISHFFSLFSLSFTHSHLTRELQRSKNQYHHSYVAERKKKGNVSESKAHTLTDKRLKKKETYLSMIKC